MDYFFAQIEEKRHPEAIGRIIVVCVFSGRTADSGVVSTVNYAGRAIGIHSGMPIFFAKKRAQTTHALFLPVDHEYYALVSSKIDDLIRTMGSKVAQASIDEWNIEMQDTEAKSTANEIKSRIKAEMGLTCTVGVAPSLLGAKMAAAKAKPDGFLALTTKTERELIDNSSVEKVPGIGPKTTQALVDLGITNVGDINSFDAIKLVEIFGRKTGSWLHDLGQGRYLTGLGEEKEQEEVSRIGTLKEKTRDPKILADKLEDLEKEAKNWLLQMKKSYKTIGIIFITEDLKTHTKSLSFRNPKSWNESTTKEKAELIQQFLVENQSLIRRIGIRFGNFTDMGGQTTLF